MDFGFLGKKAPTNPITAGFGSSFFTGTSNFLSSVSAKKDGIFSDLSNKVDSLIKGEEVVPTPPAFNRNPPGNVPPQHPLPQGQQRPLGFPPILPGNQPRGITPQQGFPPVLPDPKLARQQGLHTPRIGVPVALKSTPPPTTGVPHKVPEKTEPLASRRDLDGKTLQNGSGTTQDERDSLQESRIGSSGQPKPAQKPGQPTGERYPGQKPAERPIPKTAAERQSQRSSPSAEQGQRSSPTPAERQKPGERRGQRPGGPSDRPTAPGRKTPQPQSERQAQKTPSDRQRASPQPTERHSSRSSPTQRSKPEPVERRLSRSGKELSITERGQDQIERLRDQRPGQEPVTRRTSRGSQELTERHRSGQEPVDHRGQRASQESVDRYGPKGQEISDRQRPGQDPLDHSGRHPQRSGIDPADRHRSATDLSDPHKSSFGDPRDPRYQEAAELSQRTAGQPRSGPEPAQRRSQRSSPIPAQRRSQRSSPEPPQRRSQRIEQDYHDSIGSKATPSLRSQRSTELHSQRSIQDGHRLDRESIERYSQRSIDDSLDRYGTRLDRESIERHSQRSFDEPISRQANQRTAPPLASQRGQRSGSDYFEQHSSPEPADRPRVSRQTQRVTDDPERSVLRSPSSEAEYYHSHRAAPPLPDKHTQKVAPEPARRQTNRADRESDYYRHRPDHDIAKPTPIPADRHRSAFRPIDRPGRRSAPRLGEYTDRELTDRQRAVTSGRLSEPSERILRSPSSEELEREMSDRRSGKFTSGRRRSGTVGEMLFDDYVEPPGEQTEAPSLEAADTTSRRRAMNAMGDLISFDGGDQRAYNERRHKPTAAKRKTDRRRVSPDSSGGGYGGEAGRHSSIDSSGDEFGGGPYRRSLSMESEQSWDSTYGIESQPDDITLECMEFMKMFVEKIFLLNEEISQTEKAKFGELCQHQPGRLWFARYVNSQRVHNKKVDEQIFFRLVQYFSVVLFECHMAEDYTPAKSLMNMCFTFFYENNIKYGLGPLAEDGTQTNSPPTSTVSTQTIETKSEYQEPTRFRDVGTVPRTPSVTKPITHDVATMTASVRTRDICISAKLQTHDIAVAANFKAPERPPVIETHFRTIESTNRHHTIRTKNTATSPVRFYEYMKPAVITHEVAVGPSLRTRSLGVGDYFFRTHEMGIQTDRDIPDIVEPGRRPPFDDAPLMSRLSIAAGRKRKSQSTDELTKLELDAVVADKHRVEAETNLYRMEKKRIEAQLAYYGVDSQRVEAQKRYHQLKIKKLEREMALRE